MTSNCLQGSQCSSFILFVCTVADSQIKNPSACKRWKNPHCIVHKNEWMQVLYHAHPNALSEEHPPCFLSIHLPQCVLYGHPTVVCLPACPKVHKFVSVIAEYYWLHKHSDSQINSKCGKKKDFLLQMSGCYLSLASSLCFPDFLSLPFPLSLSFSLSLHF